MSNFNNLLILEKANLFSSNGTDQGACRCEKKGIVGQVHILEDGRSPSVTYPELFRSQWQSRLEKKNKQIHSIASGIGRLTMCFCLGDRSRVL